MSNPLLDADNLLGFAVFIATIGSLIVGFVKWVNGKADAVKTETDAKAMVLATELRHKMGNLEQDIQVLERRDDEKEIRLVKVELGIEQFTKGQERLEALMERKFDSIEQSIREVRDVRPKPRT